mmetsp:Transcript_33878/g.47251  ORF Transcript_33878/g.47251 Transcript_33878/m.47251 type:complete len:86 (+) Transcript_33878:1236-1493(+)
MQDEEIDIRHGRQLYAKSGQKLAPWWVDGGGHNDIEFETRGLYFQKLKSFLKEVGGEKKESSHTPPKRENEEVIEHQVLPLDRKS